MKRLFRGILASILLGMSSCYAPRNLQMPMDYLEKPSPYVNYTDEENNITYWTLRNTRNYIDEVKDRIPKLVKIVEEFEGINRDIHLSILLLDKRNFRRLEKNCRKLEKNVSSAKGVVGFSDMKYKSIGWSDCGRGFVHGEQSIFCHEYVHFLDDMDGKTDLSEEEVLKKEEELSKIIK